MGRLDGIGRNFLVEVDFGDVPGYGSFIDFGKSKDNVGNSFETIWFHNSEVFWPPAMFDAYVYSTDNADTFGDAVGVGVVSLEYLDDNYVQHNIDVNMNGQAGAFIAGDFFRSNFVDVKLDPSIIGSNGSNVGSIYVGGLANNGVGVPDDVVDVMAPGTNSPTSAKYTVPAGKKFTFQNNIFSSSGNREATIEVWVHIAGIQVKKLVGSYSVTQELTVVGPNMRGFKYLPSGTDVWINAKAYAQGSVEVTAGTTLTVKDV